MKNGDHLTGSVVKSDGKTVVLKTDYAGDVMLKFDAIQDITTTGDLTVGLRNGRTLVGPVSTSGDNVVVTTKPARAGRGSEIRDLGAAQSRRTGGL